MSLLQFLGLATPPPSLQIGDPAPALLAPAHDGSTVDFAALYRLGLVAVYFYPKADTPGCTAQACSLRNAFRELDTLGVTIIGVSGDNIEAQSRFREKYQLPFLLVADRERHVADAFRVPNFFGMPKRQCFLIRNGRIAWHDASASTTRQGDDLLAALERLKVED